MNQFFNPEAFHSLRERDFRLYWSANTLSKLGSEVTTVAMAWQVYLLTHQPLSLGLIGLVKAGPVILFSIFGGAMADVIERRKLLLFTQSAMMVLSSALAVLAFSGRAHVGLLYLIIFLAAIATSVDSPTQSAIIPSLVPRHLMTNAITLNNLSLSLAGIFGPALGGLIIGGLGVGPAYTADACSFLAVLGMLLVVRPPHEMPELTDDERSLGGSWRRIQAGFAFLRTEPIILSLMLLDFGAMVFGASLTLLPVFAKDILKVGAQGLGLLSSAPAVGAMLGAAGLTLFTRPKFPGRVVLATIGVYGLCTAVFGWSRLLWLSWLMLLMTGAADTVSMTMRQSIRQLLTPEAVRGRIAGVNVFFAVSGTQLGEFESGVVAQLLGSPVAVGIGGAACVVMVLAVTALNPLIRDFVERPASTVAL